MKLETIIGEGAKARQKEHGGTAPGKSLVPNSAQVSTKTRDEIAKLAGVGHDTIAKIKVIEREATPEQKEALSKGTKKINKVYREIRPLKPKEEVIEEVMKDGEEERKICRVPPANIIT